MLNFVAIVDGVTMKKDSTLSIRLGTNELTPGEAAEIFKHGNKYVYIGMDEAPITKLDVPKEITEFDGQKSTSERLHDVLYVLWNTKTDKTKDFDSFRKAYMEKFIQIIKDKLN